MANYNCTLLGCVSALTGTYSTLQQCEDNCVGWGCPNQLESNTNILVVFDITGSYGYQTENMESMYNAFVGWRTTLQANGWTGKMKFTLGTQLPRISTNPLVSAPFYLKDSNNTFHQLSSTENPNESWLYWASMPYVARPHGGHSVAGEEWYDIDEGQSMTFPSGQVSEKFLSAWVPRPGLNGTSATNTGATYFDTDTLVVSLCHESNSAYHSGLGGPDETQPTAQFKSDYKLWDIIWDGRTVNCTPKGFLLPVINQCDFNWHSSLFTTTMYGGIASIYNGNQVDTLNGGTGINDGTWITYLSGETMPNGNICQYEYCSTYPDGPATLTPCDPSHQTCIGCSDPDEKLCYWYDHPFNCADPNNTNSAGGYPQNSWCRQGYLTTSNGNPHWVGNQPTWGGLIDKGWEMDVSLTSNVDSQILSTLMVNQIGTIATQATGVTSAQTLYTLNVDYPYSSQTEAVELCFPSLLPWECDINLGYCTQQAGGQYGWTNAVASSIPAGTYSSSTAALEACSASCIITSAYTCSEFGCQPDNSGIFSTLSACTAQCQSYSCTTEGCYGPFQGTGTTGTYSELSACTATCYHYECVTDSYATQVLPNIYYSGSNTINGCVQLPGSGGTSPNAAGFNEYSTLSSCTASCISWQCCEDLAITPNSVMYVYYDITSMNNLQTRNAIQGIVDWTENHLEFTGHTYHMLWWSERWLTYPNVHYTLDVYRFTDNAPSSYWDATTNQIQYLNGSGYATGAYNHSNNYWGGTNSPKHVLGELYQTSITYGSFAYITDSTNYTGNATHSIHDSFAPGATLPGEIDTITGLNILTKGYDGIQTASTTDDVITVVFQDETYAMYHNLNYAVWGSEPTNTYKLDHAIYMSNYNSVTGTTASGGTGGNLRSFLYPTQGANYGAGGGFALHAVAAIHSGDMSPRNGLWSATTYPKNNSFTPLPHTHAQCEYDLVLLSNINSGGTANPYWDSNGDGTFAPTWGALDQYGWRINFRFDTYDQGVFETDLTTFLTATTISCDTICNSGHTAPNAEWPYSSLTQCEGLVSLGECTGCTRFNCGPNGCYTATTGQYSCLSDCTASCYSYSCTTTGCTDHNPPTGTTFPYVSTDGVSYYSYYGTGGTFSSNTDCGLVCNSWECGLNGCYQQTNGTGGTYSSETQCYNGDQSLQLPPCSGYNCTDSGCTSVIGNNYSFSSLTDCQTGCTHWECDIVLGCIEVSGDTFTAPYGFATQSACTNMCASFNCGNNGCYQLNNLSGTFQDINQLPVISSAACTASCVSYNCGTSGCSEVTGTGGTYSTSASCTATCVSYSCGTEVQGGCGLWNVPNYGTGGTFANTTACTENCISYECGINGCNSYPWTGGTYSSLADCLTQGFHPTTGTCTTWNCTATGCVPITGTSGQFSSLSSCTGVCTSYSCKTGTATAKEGGGLNWSGGGCQLYNVPNYGTGGTFLHEWQCSGGCRSWDCTYSGCVEVSAGAGSGATYLTAGACDSGCTSYNCGDTGCTSQVGSGGTYFNSTNPDWGITACTGTCISYNCDDWGCLPPQQGSGGTYFNVSASVSALTSCTASCISYECHTGGCQTFNVLNGYGTGGTYTAMSSCTASCISWGCQNRPIEVDSKIYAYYDTTSMSVQAAQDAIIGLENWVNGIQGFTGSLYHTLNNDERWLSWASSVYQSAFTAGTSTMFQNPIAMAIHDWASGLSMTNVYDNMAPGNSNFLFPGITTTGPAPAADHDDNVLVITFIDESGPNNGLGTSNVYTSDDSGSISYQVPNFSATLANPLDQPTPTWKVDFTAYSATYATVTTAGGSLNCFMYPTYPSSPVYAVHSLFALHAVAAIDSGNQTAGAQGENWQVGTAPRRAISGGAQGSTPELCTIADLTALEVSNPYLLTVDAYTPNVGKLDTKGWGYNINFGQYTSNSFNNDLGNFLNTITSNLTFCISAQTTPTNLYPFTSESACTADCTSYECTFNGCEAANTTAGTPTYYTTLADCQSACTSWNCTTTACTEQAGTGGTFTNSGSCVTACTSYNCEDITVYTPSSSWPLANGCLEQIGSGGTFYGAAAGSSGSSIFGWTACTAQCQSYNCVVSCTGGTTGCTTWPNTAATYTALTSCTANCSIDWYCTEEYINDTCNGLIDSTYVDFNFYGSGLPYFVDDPNNHNLNFANYKFTKIIDPALQSNFVTQCVSPWNASYYQGPLPTGYFPNTLGYYSYINYVEIFDPAGSSVAGPYYNWSTTLAGILGLNDPCIQNQGLSVSSTWLDVELGMNNCNYSLSADYSWCNCYTVPCDIFCDDGSITIPATAQGPFTSSGAAESACCVSITYSCVTATTLDSCSGRTTLPGQFNSTTDAWDWLTVNLPNTNLTTLAYESTTPAVTISGACAGPNGGVLYEIAPVSYSLLNANVSYNTWNLFINQMQGAGTTGILSGMSYSNVNNYVYAQSGQTIKVCDEICHCSVTPCQCIELYDGTGQYTTYADCISGTTGLPACCPDTGTTSATSWDCTSGITYLPICDTKPYIGNFNDQFTALDYFRVGNPTGIFGQHRMTNSNLINNLGTSVVIPAVSWTTVQTNINSGYTWQSCFKQFVNLGPAPLYRPYRYIKSISHPGVTGGLEYTNWNAFYTAAAASFTLTTSLNALQVCQSIDNQYFQGNTFGCVVDTMKCCNEEDCYCYELYTTGGTYFTQTQCEDPLSGCCPEYTGWTCEYLDPMGGPSTFSLPCQFVTQSSPLNNYTIMYYDTSLMTGQLSCNNSTASECQPTPVGDFWSCVTTNVNTCDPDGSSLGEITGTTLGPNMNDLDFTYGTLLGTNTQYPFSSTTDQLWPLLQPTSLSIGSYLGGYGQAETILTDYHYYDPYTPLSSTTFGVGSLDILGTSVINPNDPSCVYPLPYTLPVETCMGINATGGTGMPLFSILSIAHRDINYNTPYHTWGGFIDAAVALGYQVSTANTIADFGLMYPLTFGCSLTNILTQTSGTAGAPWYSGCNWTIEMVPCLCDTTCCCETGFTSGFTTEAECLDPISGCCPELTSYTCTIGGCVDPGNGSGEFSGLTALADCEAVCKEWKCVSSSTITDTCSNKTILPSLGTLPNISEYSPSYSNFNRGPWDALGYFADPSNGLQGAQFDLYKWDCGQGCGWTVNDCDAPLGSYKYLADVHLIDSGNAMGGSLDLITGSTPSGVFYFSQVSFQGINNWVGIIDWLNNNITINGQSAGGWTYSMDYNTVAQILWNGVPGTQFDGGWELVPMVGSCICNPGPCGCVLTGGTGHSGTYHLVTGQTQCEWDCCSGVTIPECAILITGQEEGVLYYDFDTNATTKLFDTPAYERLDIAARQDKLWIYADTGSAYEIKEYDVTYSPYFQQVFNRDISVSSSCIGRGLTPTEDPNILLTANDKVYKLDITTNVASCTLQFPLPSGLTCTGDILYDDVSGNMIITYGTGATQYVGKFNSTGTLLEESHINTTTPGIGTGETIDSLFNYGTWTTLSSGYQVFNQPYTGPIYGITTERRVIELLQNPLQFAPVETQTLTLVNQISNKVHGATNIFNVVNGMMHGCVEITDDLPSDVYWCDETLGCLAYPSNVTPPNSYGPHATLADCQTHCNFVCGDCASSCECELIITPISPNCGQHSNMADCISNNQLNPNIIHGGDGCCNCYECDSVTYYGWNPFAGWVQYTVNSNVSFTNGAQLWSISGTYNVGDVVIWTNPDGDKCCYTYVNDLMPNSPDNPYDEWSEYSLNYTNNFPHYTEKIYWIPCDEDCPTIVTWSCVTGTTVVSNDTCSGAQDTGAQGLSFTPQISYIAGGGFNMWNAQFETLKWDCASQQNPLPQYPCPAVIGHWAKIIGCRVTHVANAQPTPQQGALKTTWADFVDHINSLFGGVPYNFLYGDNWQDIEGVLGNHVGIECIWEYCECNPALPSPVNDDCYNKIDVTNDLHTFAGNNNPNLPQILNFFTTQLGGALNLPGASIQDYKYEVNTAVPYNNPCHGPLGGEYKITTQWTQTGCATRHNVHTASYTSGDGFGGWTNYGEYVDWWNNQGMSISSTPLSINDSWNTNKNKIANWCGTGPDPDNGHIGGYGFGTRHCNCTYPPTPSYEPCHCEPIYGPGGYPTSAMCEEICCSGETSWSCNTGTTIAVTSSLDCMDRPNEVPILMTSSNILSNSHPLGYVGNPLNTFQSTTFASIKFAQDGSLTTAGAYSDFCHDVGTVTTPNGTALWGYIGKIFTGTYNTPSYIESTTSWADFIQQCQAYGHPVNLNMSVVQVYTAVGQMMGVNLEACTCPGTPCGCVEIPGNTGYPTSASCESVCCPITANTMYECTLTGCFQTPNGTFSTLADCENVCKEWICDEGDCIGSCDTGGNNTPRTELPSWFFGIPEDIIGYVASPGTVPVQSPLLPTITGNMQQADITYYKFDCVNCASPIQTCPSPNGTWWAPSGMYIENTPNSAPFIYSGPHNTWQDVVTAAQQQGFNVNINTSYDDFRTALMADLRQVVIKGDPCYGQPTGCDCIEIPGTGHTGGWDISDYLPCVSACCSGVTYDCTLGGCISNNMGTGQYTTMSACTADCMEYQCIPGTTTNNTCSGQTLLNVDWTNTPLTSGFFDQKQASYFADPSNGLQYSNVANYKWFNENGPVNQNNNYCTHTINSGGTTMDFDLKAFKHFKTVNNTFSQSNAVFENANNYNPITQQCDGTGCEFSTWAQLVAGCNIMGVTTFGGNQITLNNTFMEVRQAISLHWGLAGSIIRLYSSVCLCYGTPCYCNPIVGTGHTGNFYSDLSLCNIAANSNPCCTPPGDLWYCQPGLTQGGLQGECRCEQLSTPPFQGATGYTSLQDCKASPTNCCSPHYYDCLNQGTPQAGCVGLVNNNVGPYQTAADCDDDCEKLGYNCEIDDGPGNSGPGGSGSLTCMPCIGLGCQYTYQTAAGAPYFGDALQQCQDSCPAQDCWKCCMNKFGNIFQLSPALSPSQCVCPAGTVQVACDGSGPCPHPVSCAPGYVYSWQYCECICQPNVSCAPGYHWSYTECECVPNIIGPVDFVGGQGEVLQSIADFTYQPGVKYIINDFLKGIQLLDYMSEKGYFLGRDECTHCTDGTQGICVLDGCLYYPSYETSGNLIVGWKSLLVTGESNGAAIGTCTPISVNGYYPLYTTASCAELHQGGNGTYHTHELNSITYYMPNGLTLGVTQYHGDYIEVTTTPILTGATLQGYSCVDNPSNPPTYTECLEYGTAPYLAYFGNAAPQYSTLQECYAAGCDFSGTVYYQCTVQTNTLVGENQQACVPVDGVGGPGLFTSLEECLNSGCAGWMACDATQVTSVNGIDIQDNSLYPIPMCCESYINTAMIPLTVTDCENHCNNINETWFPLYNVIGINTFYESPLGYLLRELNPYVRNGSCAVSLTPTGISAGRTQRTVYDINY